MEASSNPDGTVTLRLGSAEALVLFEWLHRNEAGDTALDHLGIEDDSERQVLWSMSASLESTLSDPFSSDYREVLEAARASLRPSDNQP